MQSVPTTVIMKLRNGLVHLPKTPGHLAEIVRRQVGEKRRKVDHWEGSCAHWVPMYHGPLVTATVAPWPSRSGPRPDGPAGREAHITSAAYVAGGLEGLTSPTRGDPFRSVDLDM